MDKKINITPNASILHSLKRTGYHWAQALMDIVDNSVDALRVRYNDDGVEDGFVRIIPIKYTSGADASKKKTKFIAIADNGTGISPTQLQEILRLGESGKRGTDALGTFGMGLKTAAMSLGGSVVILSTTSTSKELCSIKWDINQNLKTGKFIAHYNDNPSSKLVDIYLETMEGDMPGTMVLIGNLHEGIPTAPAIIQTISAKCAHTYRHMLNNKSPLGYDFPFKIIAGKTSAAAEVGKNDDPLCTGHEHTNILIGGEDGSFETVTYGNVSLQIRMTCFEVEDGHNAHHSNKARKGSGLGRYIVGTHKQGVYWIREGREICCGPFWSGNPTYSNVYAEIGFEDSGIATTDSPIRMNFGKTGVELDDDLRDHLLRHVFGPHLEKIRSECRGKAKDKKKSDRTQIMAKVAADITLPTDHFGRSKAPAKDRKDQAMADLFSPPKKASKPVQKNGKYRGAGLGIGNNQVDVSFEELRWPGSTLPFSLSYLVGDPVCKIQLNIEHAWVEQNIYLNDDTKHVTRSLQAVASMAIAPMYHSEEERHELYVKFGALLTLFRESFGRLEPELEETELQPAIATDPELFQQAAEAK